jgi:uncharacterized OB-fold protein
MSDRIPPAMTPITAPYWDGAAAGELRLQRCVVCTRFVFPPRTFCPHCGSASPPRWESTSGVGRLLSYIIARVPVPGGYDEAPYVVALVELQEGPRLLTNIIDVDLDKPLPLDMPVTVSFEPRGPTGVPVFRPTVS